MITNTKMKVLDSSVFCTKFRLANERSYRRVLCEIANSCCLYPWVGHAVRNLGYNRKAVMPLYDSSCFHGRAFYRICLEVKIGEPYRTVDSLPTRKRCFPKLLCRAVKLRCSPQAQSGTDFRYHLPLSYPDTKSKMTESEKGLATAPESSPFGERNSGQTVS